MRFVVALILALLSTIAHAQPVSQSGNVTPGHAAQWVTTGVIKDAGTAANGFLSTLGVTNNGGPGFCVASAAQTAAGRNQLCLAATTNGGTKISSYIYGTATNPGIVFDINGSVQGFPAVTLPVVNNDAACFDGTTGQLKDCGAPPLGGTLTSAHIFVGNASNVATDRAVTGDISLSNTGATTLVTAQPGAHTWALGQTFSSTITAAAANFSGNLGLGSTGSQWDNSSPRLVLRRDTSTFPVPGATTALALFGPGTGGEGRLDIGAVAADAVMGCFRVNTSWSSPTVVTAGQQICGWTGGSIDTNGSTTIQQGGYIGAYALNTWSPTDHSWYWDIGTIAGGSTALVNTARFTAAGGFSVGASSSSRTTAVGIINADVGFTVAGAAATSGNVLRGDATKFVSAQLACSDLSGAGTGCSAAAGITALTGDVTATGPGSVAATLATVASAGTTGSSTAIPVVTINAKGLTTSITTAAVVAPAGTLTGATLAAGVTASSLTSLGTITSLTATTINAFTLGGTISGGGNQINNAIIGTTTPLAGFFTTLSATTSLTSPLHIGGSGTTGTQLTLQTTTGNGTTDALAIKGGNNGATTIATMLGTGFVGIGDTSPQYKLTISKNATAGITDPFGNDGIGMIGADGASIGINAQTFGNNIAFINFFRAGGTNASKTAVTSGTTIGQFNAFGYAGATSLYNGGAGFQVVANQTFSTGNAGTRMEINTTPDASVTSAVAVTIYGSKSMAVGVATDPGAGSLQLNGQIFMPNITTTSAAQTGTVCWTTGTGKFTVDTTVGCLTSLLAAKNVTGYLAPSRALDIVAQLNPFSFRYKAGWGDGGRYEQFGLGAEEVMMVDERLVGRDPEGALQGVRYQELTAVLVGAVKELKADNDNLREEINKITRYRQ